MAYNPIGYGVLPMQVVRQQPLYPGQMGVPGSDVERGLRSAPRGVTLHVDPSHTGAIPLGDGTDPEHPLDTLQQAVTNLFNWDALGLNVDYSTIIVSGDITESVSILDYTTYPSYCNIVGVGPGPFSPAWGSAATDTPCLVAGAVGWRISGIRFYCPAEAAAVVVPCTQAPYGGNAIGIRTIIDNCYFDGSDTTGLYGIDLHGAPYNPTIVNNIFAFLNGGASFGIVSTNTGYADAYRAYIANNWFHESDGGIDASLNVSVLTGNTFQTGGTTTMTTPLDLRLGTRGENVVSGNFLGGDYSNTGGYYANAANPGNWIGNVAQDTAEAEVGDNGWTIAIPAA